MPAYYGARLRLPRVHHPRPRRACTGELLIQIDGCKHRWIEERGPACTLLVYVDDATSWLIQLSPILKSPRYIWSITVSIWRSKAQGQRLQEQHFA